MHSALPCPAKTLSHPRATALPHRLQPEAALPPPFPTAKPRRAYISNMAVLQQHRRRGVATALLRQCERMARLWRRDSLWLHVDLRNQAAMQVRLADRSRHLRACYLQPLAAHCLASSPWPLPYTSLNPPSALLCLPIPWLACSCTKAWVMPRWGGTQSSPPIAAA